MLRIYFTSDDLARTKIACAPDPLWELVLSLQMLRPQRGDALFVPWRRNVRSTIRATGLAGAMPLLTAITPNVGYFPDFLNPIEAVHGLDHGLEAIRRTPRSALRHDIDRLSASQPLPDAARQLAAGDPHALTELTSAMHRCYEKLVAPYHRCIETAVDRDRRRRVNALTQHGVEGLLASLEPMITWVHGELCVPSHRDQELHLEGRGLLLIPSYFCVSGPLTLFDPALPPVLIYPVERNPDDLPGGALPQPATLDALLGATRAAVLEAIGTREVTTSELARRIGIGAASASEHAKVLREAGLVTSQRDRNRMLHNITPLGMALLAYNR